MIIHTVLAGETLSDIARLYSVDNAQLISSNGIRNPDNLVVGQTVIIEQDTPKLRDFATLGYAYPFIDRTVLRAILPELTYLSVFTYRITEEGMLEAPNDDTLITEARNARTVPIMVVTAMDRAGNFSGVTAANVMSDAVLAERAANAIAEAVRAKGYGGVDLDFEFIPAYATQSYANFINLLKEKIAPSPVFAALAPKTYAEQPGLLYEAHDYAVLGAAADKVLLMTYEWGYAYGPPGAVAPINNVSRVLDYALTEIPADKIILGYPNYGYDWTLPYKEGTRALTIGNEEAVAIASQKKAVIEYNDQVQAPYFYYVDDVGASHVVWFEDARSTRAKCLLASNRGLYGLGIWNVMRPYTQLSTILNELFDITKLL